MTEKIAHTKGRCYLEAKPYEDGVPYFRFGCAGPLGEIYDKESGLGFQMAAIISKNDAELIVRFREVPHHCTDPNCPGDINRRMLEAFGAMLEALNLLIDLHDAAGMPNSAVAIKARKALALADNLPSRLATDEGH